MGLKIRNYVKGDASLIEPNKYSSDNVNSIIRGDPLIKYTLEKDGRPVCIVAFIEYADKCFNAMIAADASFGAADAVVLRKSILDRMETTEWDRLQTISVNDKLIDRFHKFLGFSKEGVLRKFMSGKDYSVWSIVNGS